MAITDKEEESLFMLVKTLWDLAERYRKSKPELLEFIDGQQAAYEFILDWFAHRETDRLEKINDVAAEGLQQAGVSTGGAEHRSKTGRAGSSFQIMRSWPVR